MATSPTRFEAFSLRHAQQPVRQPEPESPSLSDAVDHYEREQWAAGRWKAEEAGHAAMAELRRFLQHTGDRPVAGISREDVRAFRDHRCETLRASALNIKVMSRLVSFFNHCREEGWVTKLPTNGLRVRDPISNRDRRRTFTLPELQRVFGPEWKHECADDDHKFHCGRLLLATGARAEEIAQIRVADVIIDRRELSLRITDAHPEQRLKNAASRRVVLHSLRHTVKQMLQEAGAPDSLVSDLLGHAGQGQTNGTYGEAATVERMAEWVECVPIADILGRRSRSSRQP